LAQMCREKISGDHVYADRSRHLSTASAMAFVQFTRIAGQDLFVRRMGLGRVAVPGLDGRRLPESGWQPYVATRTEAGKYGGETGTHDRVLGLLTAYRHVRSGKFHIRMGARTARI